MFCPASLAARIERAETSLVLDGARAALRRIPADQIVIVELNGGAAVFVEEGSLLDKVVGLGFDGVPEPGVLDEIERRFAERRAPVQVELPTLADPQIALLLTRRRYELVGFENVLGVKLDAPRVAALEAAAPPNVSVARATDDHARVWMDTVSTGFLHPDVFDGPPSHETLSRDAIERVFADTVAAPTFERYLARLGGEIAGGASFRVHDGVAQLAGAATLPAHRRRGVQSALLVHRLLEAARRGCDVAVVTTQPGSKSMENVLKAGFSLLYARAILVKAP